MKEGRCPKFEKCEFYDDVDPMCNMNDGFEIIPGFAKKRCKFFIR